MENLPQQSILLFVFCSTQHNGSYKYLTFLGRYCFSERWRKAGQPVAISSTEGRESGRFWVSSLVQGFCLSLQVHRTILDFRPLSLPACQTCWKHNCAFASRHRTTPATLPKRAKDQPLTSDILPAWSSPFCTISHNNANSLPDSPVCSTRSATTRHLHTIVWHTDSTAPRWGAPTGPEIDGFLLFLRRKFIFSIWEGQSMIVFYTLNDRFNAFSTGSADLLPVD